MAVSTYAELKTAVADFLNRDDLTSAIPTFVSLAEASIARDLRHWRQEKRVTLSVDAALEDLPSDWLSTVSLRHSDGTEIEQVGLTEMASLHSVVRSGKPLYYRVEAGQIEFYPAPDSAYDVDFVYFGRVAALSDAAPTNWLLTNHPDILLYGSLLHSAPYLGDDARSAVWASLYASALASAQNESGQARHSGPLRMKIKA